MRRQRRPMTRGPDTKTDPADGFNQSVRKTRVGPSRRRIGPSSGPPSTGRRRLRTSSGTDSAAPQSGTDATSAVASLRVEVEGIRQSVAKTRVGPSRRGPRPSSAAKDSVTTQSTIGVAVDTPAAAKGSTPKPAGTGTRIGPSRRRAAPPPPGRGARAAGTDDSAQAVAVSRAAPLSRTSSSLARDLKSRGASTTRTHIGPQRGQRRAAAGSRATVAESRPTSSGGGNDANAPATGPVAISRPRVPKGVASPTTAGSAHGAPSAVTTGDAVEPPAQLEADQRTRRIGPRRAARRLRTTAVTAANGEQQGPGKEDAADSVEVGPRGARRSRIGAAANRQASGNEALRLGPTRRRRDREATVAATEGADISVTGDTPTMIQTTRIGPSRGNRRRRAPPPPPKGK